MQQRFNNQSFHTLAFIMEHDYAGCAAVSPRMAAPFQANLDRVDFEQRVPLMSRLYEDHFVRSAVEYLGAVGDGAAILEIGETALYPEAMNCGFTARRFEGELVVTQVWADGRLEAGDRIAVINGYDIPAFAKQAKHVLFDQGGCRAHEAWDVALAFSRHFDVRRKNGQTERMKTQHFRAAAPCLHSSVADLGNGTLVIRPGSAAGGPLSALLRDRCATVESCGAVIDLRESTAMSEEDALALLPLVVGEPTNLEELPGFGPFYLWCSPNNCRMTADILAASAKAMESQGFGTEAEEAQVQADEIRNMSGEGFQLVDLTGGMRTPVEPFHPQVPVVLLADTATAGLAESLVRIAKLSGRSTVVGRSTRGTLDYTFPLTVSLDASYNVVYPAALSLEAHGGERINGVGITPDLPVEWSPNHLAGDPDLDRALALLGV